MLLAGSLAPRRVGLAQDRARRHGLARGCGPLAAGLWQEEVNGQLRQGAGAPGDARPPPLGESYWAEGAELDHASPGGPGPMGGELGYVSVKRGTARESILGVVLGLQSARHQKSLTYYGMNMAGSSVTGTAANPARLTGCMESPVGCFLLVLT